MKRSNRSERVKRRQKVALDNLKHRLSTGFTGKTTSKRPLTEMDKERIAKDIETLEKRISDR